MDSAAGSYALIFSCRQGCEVAVGRLGRLHLVPGYYVYLGSALGPGGVRARTAHHRRHSPNPHWHLDYLRPSLQLLEIWYTQDGVRREHQWTEALSQLRGARAPFPGFGASDCSCPTHLLAFAYKPSFAAFRRRMRRGDMLHGRLYLEKLENDALLGTPPCERP